MHVVRMEQHEKAEHPMQKIVPIGVAAALCETPVLAASQPSVINALRESIVMRKDGIEIELPQNMSEDTILALLRGMKQC